MPRGPDIPDNLRYQIVGMRRVGATYSLIESLTNVKLHTAKKIFNRWEIEGSCQNRIRGRPQKKLSTRDINHVSRHIKHDRHQRRQPLSEIINTLQLDVCTKTLKAGIVDKLNLARRIERKKPWLSLAQKQKRLQFAKDHLEWGLEEWRRCGFTDEMTVQTTGNSTHRFVWRSRLSTFKEDCLGATIIPGFEKVKVWGVMRYGKLSELIIIPEDPQHQKMNAKTYRDLIMDGEMYDFWIEGMEDMGWLLMMEDGAPYHRGLATERRKELEEVGWIGWGPLTWPSNSPDLNPIENLWHILKSNIHKQKHQP